MALNRPPITITWDGETYTTRVTMGFLEDLDQAVNIVEITAELTSGKVHITNAVKMVWVCLNHAGCKATYEQVFDEAIIDADVAGNVMGTCAAILSAVYPQPKKKNTASGKRNTKKQK